MPRPEAQDLPESTVQRYAENPDARSELYRRTLWVVLVSQVFGGAGLAAGVTVGALLAEELLGTEGVAGLPAALFTLGSALAAYAVGQFSQRAGRRRGLAFGFFAGAVGAVGIVLAAVLENPVLFFASLFVYGAGTATNLQARYAGTDLAPADQRGRAVSIAMVSTTLGAVAGPNLVGPTGTVSAAVGIPELAGPFLLAAVAYAVAGAVLFALLRPDPYLVATAFARSDASTDASTDASIDASIDGSIDNPGAPALSAPGGDAVGGGEVNRGVTLGAAVMILTQIAMVAIMTMTPVHMRNHGHSLDEVGFVIGMHIGAMYLPSLVTGHLVDRVGRLPMALAAGGTLLAAGLVAALAPAESLAALTLGLVLLGLGWNFGLISGTALIVDSTPPTTRARTQGSVDVLVAIAGASGGALSGFVVAGASYPVLAVGGGVLALLLVPVVAWTRREARGPREHVGT